MQALPTFWLFAKIMEIMQRVDNIVGLYWNKIEYLIKKKKKNSIIATRQDIVLSLTHEMLKHPLFICFFFLLGLVVTHDDVCYDIPFWRILLAFVLWQMNVTKACKSISTHTHTHPLVWAYIRVYHITQHSVLIIRPIPTL